MKGDEESLGNGITARRRCGPSELSYPCQIGMSLGPPRARSPMSALPRMLLTSILIIGIHIRYTNSGGVH